MHAHDIGCAVHATLYARRAEAAVVHHEGRARLSAQQLDLVVDAEAAALAPGTARALAQGETFEQDRIVLLQHLHRLALGDTDGGAAVGEAVVAGVAAIAAT